MSAGDELPALMRQLAREREMNETCPQGSKCGVHYRNNFTHMDRENLDVILIDYIGEFAVITQTGLYSDLIQSYSTTVHHVGSGTLGDIVASGNPSSRFSIAHADWSNLVATHGMVVDAVERGSIHLEDLGD